MRSATLCFALLVTPVAGLTAPPKPNVSGRPVSEPRRFLPLRASDLRLSVTTARGSQVWQQIVALEKESHLMEYRERVLLVMAIFALFEYCIDFISYSTRGLRRRGRRSPESRTDEVASQGERKPCNPQDPTGVLASLKVLTLNVYLSGVRENLDLQLKSIRALAPDVICLQEVFDLDVLNAYRLAFQDYELLAFGRSQNIMALVALLAFMIGAASIISMLVWVVEKYAEGRIRSVWTIAVPVILVIYERIIRYHWTVAFLTGNQTGLALLVRSDVIDLKERKCVTFSRAGHAADFLNIVRPRGFITATGTVRLPGQHKAVPIRLLTTHLNQPIEQALGDGRHIQVKEIFQKCLRPGEFMVIGADMNATPPGTPYGSACSTYTDIVKELKDAWDALDPNETSKEGATWDPGSNVLIQRNYGIFALINKLFYGIADGGVSSVRWRCDYIFWRDNRSNQSPEPALAEKQNHGDKDSTASKEAAKKEPGKHIEKDGSEDVYVAVRSCTMVFTGDQAISDHYGVLATFDIRAN